MKNILAISISFIFLSLSCENPTSSGLGEAPDITPPEIVITQPSANGLSFRTKDATSLWLEGTWSDNQDYKIPTISVRWIEGNLTQNATVSGKNWSLNILQAFNLGNLSSGSQNFLVTITDGSGNTNYSTRHLLIDNGDLFVTDVTSLTSNGWYKAGDSIAIRLSFNKAVNVTGTPRIALNVGSSRYANYTSGSGSNVLIFQYTVTSGDQTLDLDYTAVSIIDLNGGTLKDSSNVEAVLNLPTAGLAGSLGANKDIKVDTTAPTVVSVSSTNANGFYRAGELITIQVTFSEVVLVSGMPRIQLNTTPMRYANYLSGTSTTVLNFSYVIQANDVSPDLDYLSNSALELNGGSILDAAQNPANLTLAYPGSACSLGWAKNLIVDAQPPVAPGISGVTTGNYNSIQSFTLTSIESGATAQYSLDGGVNWNTYSSVVSLNTSGTYKIRARQQDVAGNFSSMSSEVQLTLALTQPLVSSVTSTTLDGSYKASQQVSIIVTFTAPVTVTGTPQLKLNSGTNVQANYTAGSGTPSLTFQYTISSGQNTNRLDYDSINALTLNGGTIKDAYGFDALLQLPTQNFFNNKYIVIDTVSPTVTSVTSSTPDGHYRVGQSVLVQIGFSENVLITGSPELSLNAGGGSKAVYISGNGTSSLTFLYVVAASQNTLKLNYPNTSSLTGTITDLANNTAILTLPNPTSSGLESKNIVIDTTPPSAPAIVGVSSGSYNSNQNFTINGESGASIEYSINGGISWSNYSSAVTLTDGNYAILARQTDLAGNQGPNSSVVNVYIDSGSPIITNVSSNVPNGSYIAGSNIDISVEFSKVVIVSGGTPTLTLNTTPSRQANYLSGSSTNNLVFRYVVQSGDSASDLNYLATNSLNLGTATIKDSLNNNANLTLPNPSGANSLGTNKNIVIDAVAPNLTARSPGHNAMDVNASTNIVLTFSEPVFKESGNITIKRLHQRIPVVMSVDERNFWRSKFSGTDLTNFDNSYTLTTNGSTNGTPNLGGVYVLNYNLDPNNATLINQFENVGYNTISIDVQSSRVSGHGTSSITIDPVDDLPIGTDWYVNIPSTAFRDASGNFYAGISGNSAYNFVTGPVAPPIIRVNMQNGHGVTQPTQTSLKIYTPTEGAQIRYLDSSSGPVSIGNPAIPSNPGDPTDTSTLYSAELSNIGTSESNRGFIYRIRARAFRPSLTNSVVSEELAFKTVIQINYNAGSNHVWIRGSSNNGGPTTIPGFPLRWEIDQDDYARLAQNFSNEWRWISWAIRTQTFFKGVLGSNILVGDTIWQIDPNRTISPGGYKAENW